MRPFTPKDALDDCPLVASPGPNHWVARSLRRSGLAKLSMALPRKNDGRGIASAVRAQRYSGGYRLPPTR